MKKQYTSKISYYLLLALTIAGAACSSSGNNGGNSSSTTSSDAATQYSEPTSLSASDNGGYTSSNEAPYFGLSSMMEFGSDTSVTTSGSAALDVAAAQVYMVRIVWGNLELDARTDMTGSTETVDHLDWSGSLSYDGDATVTVDRTILFDLNDSLNAQIDPTSVSWTSHTGPHVDGILVKLTVTPGIGTDALTFSTASFTKTINLADLDHFNEIDTLDSDGHGVSFTVLRTDNETCPEGFIEGKFHNRLTGDGGVFRGRVLSDTGDLDGHVRGHYGVIGGDQVFFGKEIDTTGAFQGFLVGTYADGSLSGNVVAADGTTRGTLEAKYVTGATVDSGFFQGTWQKTCE